MEITTVGIDLAKNVFQVHGVSKHGKARAAISRLPGTRSTPRRP